MEQKKVCIYCRVARNEDMALATQKQRLVLYAQEHGLAIFGISAEAAGGLTLSRTGLNEVNRAVQNGEIQYLLVNDISRLGRAMPQVVDYVGWLKANGVELICADGSTYDDCAANVIRNLVKDGTAYLASQKKTKKR